MMLHCLKSLRPALAAAALLLGCVWSVSAAPAPVVKEIKAPGSIMLIGNSFTFYNNGLHNKIRGLAVAADKDGKYFMRSQTISGANLSEHDFAFPAVTKARKWDVIVLQGNSNEPIDAKRSADFVEYSKKFAGIIRDAGVQPVFFMTWAYEGKPEMTEQLATAYIDVANATNSFVVPVGLAFAAALDKKPDLKLIMDDGRHPTPIASYLAACVFYSAFYKKSPVGNSFTEGHAEADFLQQVAWDTVKTFYGW